MKNIVVRVCKIQTDEEQQKAFAIRWKVFVEEQNVPAEEELDEFEKVARHFIAYADSKAVGTARWRFTEKGCKLERFAVLQEMRSKGVGSALLQTMLDDIQTVCQQLGKSNILLYLHAQVTAVGLYKKFGFQPEGNPFDECGIMHYLMKRNLEDDVKSIVWKNY